MNRQEHPPIGGPSENPSIGGISPLIAGADLQCGLSGPELLCHVDDTGPSPNMIPEHEAPCIDACHELAFVCHALNRDDCSFEDRKSLIEQGCSKIVEWPFGYPSHKAQLARCVLLGQTAGLDLIAVPIAIDRVCVCRRFVVQTPAHGACKQQFGIVARRVVRASNDVARTQLGQDFGMKLKQAASTNAFENQFIGHGLQTPIRNRPSLIRSTICANARLTRRRSAMGSSKRSKAA